MKKIILLLGLVALATLQVNAQENNRSYWRMSVGAGASMGENINLGFASGATIERVDRALVVGLSMHQAGAQTLHYGKWEGDAIVTYGTPDRQQIRSSVPTDLRGTRQPIEYATAPSFNAHIGLDLMRWLKGYNTKHNLIVSAIVGIGLRANTSIISNDEMHHIRTVQGGATSYGLRGTYEYMFTDRIGFGASVSYDMGQSNGYALTNLSVRF